MVYVLANIHANPVLENNTPTGGDFGAHVWGPAYLRDHILPHWRLSGWAPDWYAGFPMYKFYMVVPALLTVLLDVVLPYGVALKMVEPARPGRPAVVLLGLRRLAGLPFPIPPLLSIASVFFLFDWSFTIYGGNVASTMAGEFSFSIALCFSLLYLGVLARACAPGKGRALAALLFALDRAVPPHRRHLRDGRHPPHVPAVGRPQADPLRAHDGAGGRRCSPRSGPCRSCSAGRT